MGTEQLRIKMFGEFSIQNEFHQYAPTSSKSMQITTLIAYLIANKGVEVSKDKLIEILWPEEELSNPTGALRNLVYRARRELTRFFPGISANCILFTRNAYAWNSALDCQIDIERFETLYNLAQKEPYEVQQYRYYQEMFRIYQGNFLPSLNQEEWVMFRSIYYQNLYVKCVMAMCDYLKSDGQYQEILDLCEQANHLDIMNENIHKETLNAYLQLGYPHKALDYYHDILNLFNNRYGVDISESLEDLYCKILQATRSHQMNIDDLEENLKEDKNSKGSFYCNFDVFKNIYQINMRSLHRIRSKRYLVLLTLKDADNRETITSDVKAEMDILRNVIKHFLRKNDVFTQSSYSQFSLILTVPNEAGCHIAIERTRARYGQERQAPNVELEINIKEII